MKKAGILLIGFFLFNLGNAEASDVKTGNKVTLSTDSPNNIYIAAGEVNVNANVAGDLVAAGGEIRINGITQQDVLLTGGKVSIDAQSEGDVRVMGGEIEITQNIKGDLTITGGKISIDKGVTIGGDLIIVGGEVNLFGDVKGRVFIAGGKFFLNGNVEGGIEAKTGFLEINGRINGECELAAQKLILNSHAFFGGNVKYWTKQHSPSFDGKLASGAKATYDSSLKPDWLDWEYKAGDLSQKVKRGVGFFQVFSGLLMTLLLIAFGDKLFTRYAGQASKNAGPAFGLGMLLLFGIPILSGIAFITIIGIPVGVVGMGAYGIMLSMSTALPSVIAAYEWRKLKDQNWTKGGVTLVAVGIFLGLRLASRIPVFGSLLSFIAAAVAFGYIYMIIRKKIDVDATAAAKSDDEDHKDGEDFV
jgi:cytoskeletal protein CcmA (bactofilin family)